MDDEARATHLQSLLKRLQERERAVRADAKHETLGRSEKLQEAIDSQMAWATCGSVPVAELRAAFDYIAELEATLAELEAA